MSNRERIIMALLALFNFASMILQISRGYDFVAGINAAAIFVCIAYLVRDLSKNRIE